MDLLFLVRIVAADLECREPSAERALRFQLGSDFSAWKPPKQRQSPNAGIRTRRRINDPEGLLRSIHSTRSGGGESHYRRGAQHVR